MKAGSPHAIGGVSLPFFKVWYRAKRLIIPSLQDVAEARKETGAEATVPYVPPSGASASMLKAIEAEIILMACFAEGVQQQDMVRVMPALKISGGRYSCKLIQNFCDRYFFPSSLKYSLSIWPAGVECLSNSTANGFPLASVHLWRVNHMPSPSNSPEVRKTKSEVGRTAIANCNTIECEIKRISNHA